MHLTRRNLWKQLQKLFLLNFDSILGTSRDPDPLLKTNKSTDVTNIHHQTPPQEEASKDLLQIIPPPKKMHRRPQTCSSSSDTSSEEITEVMTQLMIKTKVWN
ncbi:hypothetical protein ILUMI_03610 [Ignelater luminosus]|uniref:Uncharacterized protein n=1 Tax=Ignelater luminosus TaxID=2038154 RepID=A0A8K0DEB4_IGNLU|nr:hypothetical protein ILUMI_03610 [Ignelater luminosus]